MHFQINHVFQSNQIKVCPACLVPQIVKDKTDSGIRPSTFETYKSISVSKYRHQHKITTTNKQTSKYSWKEAQVLSEHICTYMKSVRYHSLSQDEKNNSHEFGRPPMLILYV